MGVVWFHTETDVTTPVAICFSKRLKEFTISYERRTWAFTQGKDYEPRLAYVATSRSKRDEVMGAWRKLRNSELHNWFLSIKYC